MNEKRLKERLQELNQMVDKKTYMKEYHKKNYQMNKWSILESNKEWRQNNPEKKKESAKEYYKKNSDYCKGKSRKYYQENKERVKEHRQKNREKINSQRKEYRQKNKKMLNSKLKEWHEKNREHEKEYWKNNPEIYLKSHRKHLKKYAVPFKLPYWKYGRALSYWSAAIKKRDSKFCQVCGSSHMLNAHHIFEKKHYPELSLNESNGVTLCSLCHHQVHGRKLTESVFKRPAFPLSQIVNNKQNICA